MTLEYKNNVEQIESVVKEANDFVTEVKNILNVGHVKKMFRLGSDVFAAFEPFARRPTMFNAARAVMGVGKIIVDDSEIWGTGYFDEEGWIEVFNYEFRDTIIQVLSKYEHSLLKTSDENSFIRLVDVDGVQFGWTQRIKFESTSEPVYCKIEKLNEAQDIVRNLFWSKFKEKHIVIRNNKQFASTSYALSKIVFEIDDAFNSKSSKKADEYSKYLNRCIDAGVSRSVMLYGPPGTGKSTMARTIVENLNLRSLRIRVEDVSGIENGTLYEAISIFKPESVILDDFDRTREQSSLLETLEFFQRHVKLVIATVNNMSRLDDALLRPGRFDELVLVDKMDGDVVKILLGEYVDGFDAVKDWPIAFILEYVKRRKFMLPNEAEASMLELSQRVKGIVINDENPDEWSNLNAINAINDKKRKTSKRKSTLDSVAMAPADPD